MLKISGFFLAEVKRNVPENMFCSPVPWDLKPWAEHLGK
jgi:hypothetical protein